MTGEVLWNGVPKVVYTTCLEANAALRAVPPMFWQSSIPKRLTGLRGFPRLLYCGNIVLFFFYSIEQPI